jgi:large subunit ribosomal protein L13
MSTANAIAVCHKAFVRQAFCSGIDEFRLANLGRASYTLPSHIAASLSRLTFLHIILLLKPRKKMVSVQKTYTAKPGEIEKKWFVVDATDCVLGRLASDIATILMGKHRPTYTPHVDTGDFVVVVNAEKIVMTGNKLNVRHYTWYNGYTRQKMESYAERLERKPTDLVTMAVKRMLPKNALGRHMLDKLKVYAGSDHPHQAQQPEPLELGEKK